jgi:hypothetical protein
LLLTPPEADVLVHDEVGNVFGDNGADLPRQCDVVAKNGRRDGFERERGRFTVHVDVGDVLSEAFVVVASRGVEDEEEEVETGEEGGGEVDIVDGRDLGVVAAVEGVGGGENGSAGVEGRGDSGFRNGDSLLFLREKWVSLL